MFVKHLAIEDGDSYELVTDPKWAPVAKAIQRLDGKERTIVSLEGEGGTNMAIGGGPEACVVYVTGDNEIFHRVIDPDKTGENVTVVVGRESHQYPPEFLIAKDLAIKAAKTFAEKGVLEDTVHWLSTDPE
jgi:hypothetical protein